MSLVAVTWRLKVKFRPSFKSSSFTPSGARPYIFEDSWKAEEVNILQELSLHVSNSSNASMAVEDGGCPVLQVGQYSTLALPLPQLFPDRFADEFSLLVQMRSPQTEERSVLTMLSPDSHVMLQLRISASAVIFTGTEQRHYEFPVGGLSDGKWHHVGVSVSAKRLAVYVDCSLLESVDWVHHGLGIRTDGLLMVGGTVEGSETPFETGGENITSWAEVPITHLVRGSERPECDSLLTGGHLRQLTFLMDDPGAAQQHCKHHPPRCSATLPKRPRSSHTNNFLENLLLSSNDLEDLLGDPDDESFLSLGRSYTSGMPS
ncbi:unnamed protein product [Pleuronectes platessa]|uniref:Thrombospondin-like N-terminal domain-containing protein n=1 Tax=Pleuronectes platessa TaxID=8262 RepID=A0A9N7VED6_PLEPL|nr:unnamed protein product [Pleuronectes platessa]